VTTKSLSTSIPSGATRCAEVAFHGEHSPALGTFNTPSYPVMLESRIAVEVSSRNSNIWRGLYYIEYHPSARDEFEFIEWDLWRKSHNVTT
jgi:hypothetical protein